MNVQCNILGMLNKHVILSSFDKESVKYCEVSCFGSV